MNLSIERENDRRTTEQRAETRFFVNATDKFMSGWGHASRGNSYFCVACPDMTVAMEVESRMLQRDEFKRVSISERPRQRSDSHTSIMWHEDFTWRP